MNKIIQHSMLLPYPLPKTILISLLITLCCVACSKNEIPVSPGKPVITTRNFQFNVIPANQFDEESSKKISLKLRLTISGIDLAQHAKEILWDTIISKENLYEFTHKPGEIISTTITASPDVFRALLFNYVVIYSHHGSMATRSKSEEVGSNDAGNLTLTL
jgi:hypothetical protein